jgi:hypothetical protein
MDDLNKQIAEALGWRVELREGRMFPYCSYRPDGKVHRVSLVDSRLIPDWSTDISLALALVPLAVKKKFRFHLTQEKTGEWKATFVTYRSRRRLKRYWRIGTTPARAICCAWLEWKRSEVEKDAAPQSN